MLQRLERKISLLFCLFVCFLLLFIYLYIYFAISISRFLLFIYLFFVICIFLFLSAIFYPHFSIRIRHPQVSGPRLTDTRKRGRFGHCFVNPGFPRKTNFV